MSQRHPRGWKDAAASDEDARHLRQAPAIIITLDVLEQLQMPASHQLFLGNFFSSKNLINERRILRDDVVQDVSPSPRTNDIHPIHLERCAKMCLRWDNEPALWQVNRVLLSTAVVVFLSR